MRTKRLGIVIPLRISLIYVILGSLWILLSDTLVISLVSDSGLLTRIGILKGTFYVATTGFILFVLVRRDVLNLQRSREELSTARERYGELVENVNSIILRLDPRGMVTFINDFGLRFFGYAEQEILGHPILGTIVPEVDSTGRNLSESFHETLPHPEHFHSIEYENMRKNGERVHVSWTNKGIRDAKGNLMEILRVGNDVTERMRMQEALLKAEKMYRFVTETSPLGVMVLEGKPPRAVFLNEHGAEVLGHTVPEILDMTAREFLQSIHPADRCGVSRLHRRLLAGESVDPHQHMRILGKDGSVRWIEAFIHVIEYGEMPIMHVTFTDITEKVAAENRLQQSEARYRALFESAYDCIFILKDGVIVDCNPVAERTLGYARRDIVGKRPEDISPPIQADGDDSAARAHRIRDSVIRGRGQRITWTHQRSDGTTFEAEVSLNSFEISGDDHILAIVRDVSERIQAQTRIRETNEYLESILDHSPDAICIADTAGRFLRFNHVAEELFGYSPEQMARITVRDLYAESAQHERIEAELRVAGLVRAREVLAKRADGGTIPAEFSISHIEDLEGTPVGTVTIARDLSEIKMTNEMLRREVQERLKTEEALKRSENTYRAVFQHTGSATVILEQGGIISMVNPEFERLSGYNREEIEGRKHWQDFVRGDELDRMRDYYETRRTNPGAAPRKYEFSFFDRHGHRRNVLSIVGIIPNSGMNVASLVDVTELRRLEEQLFKADKLESIGVLAGGIAHDFNNILTAIMGNISLARMTAPGNSPVLPRLEEAEKAATRAKDLTAQLLTFSKGGSPILKTTSIVDVVRESATFALRGSNVRCDFEVTAPPWLIDADAGQIAQVIGNMVINAKQAMPHGGVVTIRVANVVIDGPHDPPLPHARYLRISISDHGSGIESSHLGKVFDPFFTTRASGSGLGLATCYSIVNKHGGTIGVTSEVGVGTTFHIYLPASAEQAVTSPMPKSTQPRAHGRILVMDDEGMIRETAVRMLQLLGYRAEAVPDGRRAIELFSSAAREGAPFDAVILDLTVPGGMGGAETSIELKKLDPRVLIIASSGYSNDPIMANCHAHGFAGVIEKPYRVQDMADAMGVVLQQREPGERREGEDPEGRDEPAGP